MMRIYPEKMTRVYECEDSIDGILSGIYQAWDARYGHDYIRLTVKGKENSDNLCLFSEYYEVQTDSQQADKVAGSVRRKLSVRVYETMIRALYSGHPEKADAVYHFLVLAFRMGEQVLDHLTDSSVQKVFELNRYVMNEAHEYLGFLRFEELEKGILLARFSPKNDLLEVVTPHFEDRFPEENFIIFDTERKKASFHRAGYPFVIQEVREELLRDFAALSGKEKLFQNLWKSFFETIAVKERNNPFLQRNNLPMHYRRYMTEF